VLSVCISEVCLELCPLFSNGWIFIPPAAHKVSCGKDLGLPHIDLLWMPNDDATSLRKLSAVLDLLEKGLHRLLWVDCDLNQLM
jgi:hypothetical protein